jgi:hypothetical protein
MSLFAASEESVPEFLSPSHPSASVSLPKLSYVVITLIV